MTRNKMKKLMIIILGVLAFSQTEAQRTNFYTTVTNLWCKGQKTEVLAMGQSRLNINSNDMAGLLIKMEYDITFLQLNEISNSIIKVNIVSETITNTNFNAYRDSLKEDNDLMLEFLTTYTPDSIEITNERTKSAIINKPFSSYKELEALQKDGLIEP